MARGSLRVWPAALVLALATARILWVAFAPASSRQDQVMAVAVTLVMASLALVVWWLFLSRLPFLTRLAGLGSLLVVGAIGASLFRFQGVSGDLVPQFGWRWSPSTPVPSSESPKTGAASPSTLDTDASYPQFLGPHRNATLEDPGLVRDWAANPPLLLWRRDVGEAWSSFAVSSDWAVTQEQRGPDEAVVAYDLLSGTPRWVHLDPGRFSNPLAGVGPRSTPLIEDGRVYSVGATGILNCLDLHSGRRIWQVRLWMKPADSGLSAPLIYGYAGAPLAVGDLIVVNSAEADVGLEAFHRETGHRVWKTSGGRASYPSAILATFAGTEQIVSFQPGLVSGHLPDDGSTLWSVPWGDRGIICAPPLSLPGDHLLISAGYGAGSRLYAVHKSPSQWSAEEVWKSIRLKSKFANVVHRGGYLYGLDDGILTCLDVRDGSRRWKKGRYGHGQILLAGDLLIVTSERGEVILLAADPSQHRELGRFQAVSGKTWNHSALVHNLLLVRNSRQAAAFRLPLKP